MGTFLGRRSNLGTLCKVAEFCIRAPYESYKSYESYAIACPWLCEVSTGPDPAKALKGFSRATRWPGSDGAGDSIAAVSKEAGDRRRLTLTGGECRPLK